MNQPEKNRVGTLHTSIFPKLPSIAVPTTDPVAEMLCRKINRAVDRIAAKKRIIAQAQHEMETETAALSKLLENAEILEIRFDVDVRTGIRTISSGQAAQPDVIVNTQGETGVMP